MFEAKFDRKEKAENGTRFWVSFVDTDSKEVVSEWCIPQSEQDFDLWVENRKQALNTAKELENKLSVGTKIEKVAPAEEKVNSLDEQERSEWFRKVNQLHRVREYFVATGIFNANDKRITDMIADIKSTEKPEYFNFI